MQVKYSIMRPFERPRVIHDLMIFQIDLISEFPINRNMNTLYHSLFIRLF